MLNLGYPNETFVKILGKSDVEQGHHLETYINVGLTFKTLQITTFEPQNKELESNS